jgi:hypothetical protein
MTRRRESKPLKENLLEKGFVRGVAGVELTKRCRGSKSLKVTLLGNKGLYQPAQCCCSDDQGHKAL